MSFRIAFYKGTRPGVAGIYNWAVRKRGNGPYSHVELIFSDGIAASSSFSDHGVRFKKIDFDDGKWDILELPHHWESFARLWFQINQGKSYDVMGNVFLAIGFFKDSWNKFFCSEAAAAALKINQPFRFEPNTLYPMIQRLIEVNQEKDKAFQSA